MIYQPTCGNELCVGIPGEHSDIRNLADYVMKEGPLSKLRNELSLLKFALEFLRIYVERLQHKVILPVDVCLKSDSQNNFRKIVSLDSSKSNADYSKSLYSIPEWVESKDRWRYQLGFSFAILFSVANQISLETYDNHIGRNQGKLIGQQKATGISAFMDCSAANQHLEMIGCL